MPTDSALSIKDASGRHRSLLNTQPSFNSTRLQPHHTQKSHLVQMPRTSPHGSPTLKSRRKYRCTEPDCLKSFTTSGHLARHNRIHTGEKNFHCRHPGCPSRFSRHDNMMQHYRTHFSPKSKRYRLMDDRQPHANVLSHDPAGHHVLPCMDTTDPPIYLPELSPPLPGHHLPKLTPLEPQKVENASDRSLLSPIVKMAPTLLQLARIVSTIG